MSDVAAETAAAEEGVEATEGSSGAVEFPDFETEVPAELLAELEEDDDPSDPTAAEIAQYSEEYGEENEDLVRRMLAAEKKAAHFEKLRVQESKKNWAEEAKKYFPLSEPFLDEIQATSKRGFLRTAKNVHERMKPLVEEKVLKPAREAIQAEKEKVTGEVKEEAKQAWGTPITKDDKETAAPLVSESASRNRRRGELSDTIRSMLFPKE